MLPDKTLLVLFLFPFLLRGNSTFTLPVALLLFGLPGVGATSVEEESLEACLSSAGWIASLIPFVLNSKRKRGREQAPSSPPEPLPTGSREGLRLMSFNVNGINHSLKVHEPTWRRLLLAQAPDMVLLQETHLVEASTNEHEARRLWARLGYDLITCSWDREQYAANLRARVSASLTQLPTPVELARNEPRSPRARAGVAIAVRHGLPISYTHVPMIPGYAHCLTFSFGGKSWVVGNVYGANQPQMRRLQIQRLKKMKADSMIWAGDFNETDSLREDQCPISFWCARQGMVDVGTLWDPDIAYPTWMNDEGTIDDPGHQSRPDRCLVSSMLASDISSYAVLSEVAISDHRPVWLSLQSGPTALGLGSSRKRTYMTRPIREANRQQWDKWNADITRRLNESPAGLLTPSSFWEAMLEASRCTFPQNRREGPERREDGLPKQAASLNLPGDQLNLSSWLSMKSRWLKVSAKRTLPRGSNSKEAATSFYRSLYSSSTREDVSTAWQDLTHGLELPSLPEDVADSMSGHISTEELMLAVLDLNKDKTPGMDGITAEMVQHLDAVNLGLWASALNRLFQKQVEVPSHWSECWLTPIYKDKNPEDWANYRPISLLCTDQKAYALILARRLMKAHGVCGIFSDLNAGFMESQSTVQNVKMLTALIDHLKRTRQKSALIFVDFLKAFDTVPWDIIEKAANFHRLPPRFVEALMALYSRPVKAWVETAQGLSGEICICQGVRQGCPLSPLTFNLVIDVLLRVLQSNERGVQWGTVRVPGLAFADDIVLVCLAEIDRSYGDLLLFCEATRMKVNPVKSALMPVNGSFPPIDVGGRPIPTLHPDQCYKYLGVWLNSQLTWTTQLQFLRRRVIARLRLLKGIRASPRGKVVAINTLALSLLNYHMQVLSLPEDWLQDLQKEAYAAVLAGPLASRFPWQLMLLSRKLGGLGLWNLVHRNRALYINAALDKFYNSVNGLVKQVAQAQLSEFVQLGKIVKSSKGCLAQLGSPPRNRAGDSPLYLLTLAKEERMKWWCPWNEDPNPCSWAETLGWCPPPNASVYTDGARSGGHLSLGWACLDSNPVRFGLRLPSKSPDIFWVELLAAALICLIAVGALTIFSDSQALRNAVILYEKGRGKDRRKLQHGFLVAKVAEVAGSGNLVWIPAHTLDSRTKDRDSKVLRLQAIAADRQMQPHVLQRGNAMADEAARLDRPCLELSHAALRDMLRSMSPASYMLELDGWGAVMSPLKGILSRQRERLGLQQIQDLPIWGSLWRKSHLVYWKATRWVWHQVNPQKAHLMSFLYNAVLGLQPTPTQRQNWDTSSWVESWREAEAVPECPFCSNEGRTSFASLRHILLECRATTPHREKRNSLLDDMVTEFARRANHPLPDVKQVFLNWWNGSSSSVLMGEGAPPIWGVLGITPRALARQVQRAGVREQDVLTFCVSAAQLALFWAHAALLFYRQARAKRAGASGPRIRTIQEQVRDRLDSREPTPDLPPLFASRRWRLKPPKRNRKTRNSRNRPPSGSSPGEQQSQDNPQVMPPGSAPRKRGRPRKSLSETPSRSIMQWVRQSPRCDPPVPPAQVNNGERRSSNRNWCRVRRPPQSSSRRIAPSCRNPLGAPKGPLSVGRSTSSPTVATPNEVELMDPARDASGGFSDDTEEETPLIPPPRRSSLSERDPPHITLPQTGSSDSESAVFPLFRKRKSASREQRKTNKRNRLMDEETASVGMRAQEKNPCNSPVLRRVAGCKRLKKKAPDPSPAHTDNPVPDEPYTLNSESLDPHRPKRSRVDVRTLLPSSSPRSGGAELCMGRRSSPRPTRPSQSASRRARVGPAADPVLGWPPGLPDDCRASREASPWRRSSFPPWRSFIGCKLSKQHPAVQTRTRPGGYITPL
jgi:endonuclease/exonuclease/phosphatase family metal-dependent hydrolase